MNDVRELPCFPFKSLSSLSRRLPTRGHLSSFEVQVSNFNYQKLLIRFARHMFAHSIIGIGLKNGPEVVFISGNLNHRDETGIWFRLADPFGVRRNKFCSTKIRKSASFDDEILKFKKYDNKRHFLSYEFEGFER